nr:hypothetical protein SHINE37_40914 [Rhizobiaceae bacterium]
MPGGNAPCGSLRAGAENILPRLHGAPPTKPNWRTISAYPCVNFASRESNDQNHTFESVHGADFRDVHSRGRQPGAARLRAHQAGRRLYVVSAADWCAWRNAAGAAVIGHGGRTTEGGGGPL